uniref:Ig-like domain-containing protein n=1 Tax=Vombatus ursinus TaxID=29139 RepID=A0A4X2LYL8_VOMUR
MEKLQAASLVILWLQLGWVISQKEEQSTVPVTVQEDERCSLNCSYTSSITNLQWYRQDPGKGLVFLMLIRSNEKEKVSERFTARLDTTNKHSSLHLLACKPEDSATYFCAVDTQCFPTTSSRYLNSCSQCRGAGRVCRYNRAN